MPCSGSGGGCQVAPALAGPSASLLPSMLQILGMVAGTCRAQPLLWVSSRPPTRVGCPGFLILGDSCVQCCAEGPWLPSRGPLQRAGVPEPGSSTFLGEFGISKDSDWYVRGRVRAGRPVAQPPLRLPVFTERGRAPSEDGELQGPGRFCAVLAPGSGPARGWGAGKAGPARRAGQAPGSMSLL